MQVRGKIIARAATARGVARHSFFHSRLFALSFPFLSQGCALVFFLAPTYFLRFFTLFSRSLYVYTAAAVSLTCSYLFYVVLSIIYFEKVKNMPLPASASSSFILVLLRKCLMPYSHGVTWKKTLPPTRTWIYRTNCVNNERTLFFPFRDFEDFLKKESKKERMEGDNEPRGNNHGSTPEFKCSWEESKAALLQLAGK